jgi:hypothetical protein
MISPAFSIQRFVEAVKGKNRLEIIRLAEKEATVAWSQTYRHDGIIDDDGLKSCDYQNKLIGLVDYMRHNVTSRVLNKKDHRIFSAICNLHDRSAAIKSA